MVCRQVEDRSDWQHRRAIPTSKGCTRARPAGHSNGRT